MRVALTGLFAVIKGRIVSRVGGDGSREVKADMWSEHGHSALYN